MRIAGAVAVLGFGLIAVLASPAAGQTTPPPVWTALEMGEWTVSGSASGDQWHYTPPVRITFDTPFSSPPAVRLAMGRVEDESRRSGSFYGAFASDVTTTGFDLTVRYAYSNSFSGSVDWIAIGEKAAVPPPQRVRTGTVSLTSALRPTGGSWQLVFRTHVSFESTFSSPPSLWLGLRSIEDYLNQIGTYYEIRPTAVTATGFDLEVYGKHAASFSTARIDWIAAGPSAAPVNPPSVQSGEHLLPPATRPTADQWTLIEQTHIAFARPFVSVPAVKVTAHATDEWTRQSGSFRWLAPINVTTSGFDLQVYAAYTESYNMDRFDWIAVEDQTVPRPIINTTKAASGPGPDGIYTEGELVTYSVVLPSSSSPPGSTSRAIRAGPALCSGFGAGPSRRA